MVNRNFKVGFDTGSELDGQLRPFSKENKVKLLKRNIGADEKAFLAGYDISRYKQPSVTTDIIAVTLREKNTGNYRDPTSWESSILLIRRGQFPFKRYLALPGGFLQPGESVEECAKRELREETGLIAKTLIPVGVFSKPGRDPRGWIISNAFLAIIPNAENQIHAGSDSADVMWSEFYLQNGNDDHAVLSLRPEKTHGGFREHLTAKQDQFGQWSFEAGHAGFGNSETTLKSYGEALAFDHAAIIATALRKLTDASVSKLLPFAFVREEFTLLELQKVFEMLEGGSLIQPNFRRMVLPMIEPTGKYRQGEGHRPAQLFRRKSDNDITC